MEARPLPAMESCTFMSRCLAGGTAVLGLVTLWFCDLMTVIIYTKTNPLTQNVGIRSLRKWVLGIVLIFP